MKTPNISHADLVELLDYDANTGVFTWRDRTGSAAAGKRAGHVKKDSGRRQIEVAGSVVKASRLAWFYVHGIWPSAEIDHRDCDVSNDALENLRECDRIQNSGNKRAHKNNSTGFKGVCLSKDRKKYEASIGFKGNRFRLGTFSTPHEAHAAYVAKARELFGEFARAA